MNVHRRFGRIIGFILMFGSTLAQFSVEDCASIGFLKPDLLCTTCDGMSKFKLDIIGDQCKECCTKDDNAIVYQRAPKAVLQVCTCKFGAYPQIQAFIKSNRPAKYKNLQIEYVHGLDPIIKLYDTDNKVKDILDIHKWDTDEVDEFLQSYLVLG